LDRKSKAVKGLAGEKALVFRFTPRHFGETPKRRGAEESDIRELLIVVLGCCEGRGASLWFL